LTLKLRNHFLFREFDPENQSVDISMKLHPYHILPKKEMYTHVQTHASRLPKKAMGDDVIIAM
jgi:hypothetical protein